MKEKKQIIHDKKSHALSIKLVTVKVLQMESIQHYYLLRNQLVSSVFLEKHYLVEQQVWIEQLVVPQVLVVSNYHRARQEF